MLKGELFPLSAAPAELTYGTRALALEARGAGVDPRAKRAAADGGAAEGQPERVTLKSRGPRGVSWRRVSVRDDSESSAVWCEPPCLFFSGRRSVLTERQNGQDALPNTRDRRGEAFEKLNHLCVNVGKERIETPELHAGTYGPLPSCREHTHTNEHAFGRDQSDTTRSCFKIPFPDAEVPSTVSDQSRGA